MNPGMVLQAGGAMLVMTDGDLFSRPIEEFREQCPALGEVVRQRTSGLLVGKPRHASPLGA